MDRPSKRRRIADRRDDHDDEDGISTLTSSAAVRSYERSISPPAVSRNRAGRAGIMSKGRQVEVDDDDAESCTDSSSATEDAEDADGIDRPEQATSSTAFEGQKTSPFRLTRIAQLDDLSNKDTVSLHDLLGDPNLTSAWLFDYLFDLNFIMPHLHRKADLAKVYVVHGSWKKDSPHRVRLDEQKQHHPNAMVRHVYWNEPFGTHHSKMMVLFYEIKGQRQARVVIHTANMISFDWANMTQGIWLSPWLPRSSVRMSSSVQPIGTGRRFKVDLLRYLYEYQRVTQELVEELRDYDFSAIRAAFIASAPSRDKLTSAKPNEYTSFGWPGLKQVIKAAMGAKPAVKSSKSNVVVQISSIATISEKWFREICDVLHTNASFGFGHGNSTRIIWPTVEEVRNSLNGYESGGSIHLKGESTAQKKQLQWLRKYWHRWGPGDIVKESTYEQRDAMRSLAAPHIKTFIRYDSNFEHVSWALLTSANLSSQAWGASVDKEGRVRISSWEVGVMVWPELFQQEEAQAFKMVPVFGTDNAPNRDMEAEDVAIIPLRIPYGLPLHKYTETDEPWCKTETYLTPDSLGEIWKD